MSFTFTEEPRGPLYDTLLEAGLREAERVGLIVQRWRSYPSSAQVVLEKLSSYLIEMKDISEWPGTRLASGYTEELRLYRYEPPVQGLLRFFADGLFDWQNPSHPDDLHFVRADGSTWLGSIAHEKDAWLELTTEEYDELRQRAPRLASILRSDSSA
jgi:hypothetical protein